ncbi:MAG: adenylate/guanylate cyclase domain-containing protein [Myxococcales bacterium]|nr:adenylate/guanylate cyclase domain-containing protein [Myxococcales bacterium]
MSDDRHRSARPINPGAFTGGPAGHAGHSGRYSSDDMLASSSVVQLISRPQLQRLVGEPLPPPASLLATWIGAIAIGSTAAAVGAYYITLTVVFPEGALEFFLLALSGLVGASIVCVYIMHRRLTANLRPWLVDPGVDVPVEAWREAMNYPNLLAFTVFAAAVVVSFAAMLVMCAFDLNIALHVLVGGLLASILDGIFAWLYTERRMRRLLRAMAARDPMLPVAGVGILQMGIGPKMALVIAGASIVGSVVTGTLAYRGATDALRFGNVDGLALQILAVTGVGLAVTLSGCLLVASQVTATLRELTGMLRELTPERYGERALPSDGDEVGELMAAVNGMLVGLEEREFIKDAFSRYVTRQVSDVVIQGGLELGGELRQVTILMADIRGFTPLSERLRPRQVVKLLNRYFTEMVEACMAHGGLIDKFIGDGLMVVFGAPVRLPPEESALSAARAAIEMKRRLTALNEGLVEDGLPALRTGVGIHSGEAIAGNIGSPQRLNYTVIGDTVNVAARLETACKELGREIVISDVVRELLGPRAVVGEGALVTLKGKSKQARVFSLQGLREDDEREGAEESAPRVASS